MRRFLSAISFMLAGAFIATFNYYVYVGTYAPEDFRSRVLEQVLAASFILMGVWLQRPTEPTTPHEFC